MEFSPKKSSYHHDESVLIQNPTVVRQISHLLRVTEDTLLAALTSKRARVSGEMLVINYRMPEVINCYCMVQEITQQNTVKEKNNNGVESLAENCHDLGKNQRAGRETAATAKVISESSQLFYFNFFSPYSLWRFLFFSFLKR